MRLFYRVIVTAAMLGLFAAHVHAAPASTAHGQKSIELKRLVQNFEGGLPGGPCPSGQFLACWTEMYGRRFCGCWNGGDRPACPSGYYYTCRVAPDGRRTCACF